MMDFVMRIYINECEKENLKFVDFQYRVRSTVTIRESRGQKTYIGMNTNSWVRYADDLVLFLPSKDTLQEALNLVDKTLYCFNLKINATKTKSMIFNHKYLADQLSYPTSIISLNNTVIAKCRDLQILGK